MTRFFPSSLPLLSFLSLSPSLPSISPVCLSSHLFTHLFSLLPLAFFSISLFSQATFLFFYSSISLLFSSPSCILFSLPLLLVFLSSPPMQDSHSLSTFKFRPFFPSSSFALPLPCYFSLSLSSFSVHPCINSSLLLVFIHFFLLFIHCLPVFFLQSLLHLFTRPHIHHPFLPFLHHSLIH